MTVEPGQRQYRFIALAVRADMVLQNDVVLGQGAGFVGAQYVHRTEVLDGIEAFNHDFALGHGGCAFGQVGTDNHRQHFWGQTDRHRQGKQEGIAPIALGEAIKEEHHRHHHQHEADQQPTDAVNPAIECGLRTRADNRLGQRAKVSPRAGRDHHSSGRTADHVGAHKADVGQVQQVALISRSVGGRLLRHIAQGVVFLYGQGFTGQHCLTDKQVAGFDQAYVGGDHVPGGQLHDVAGHQFTHGDFQHFGGGANALTAQYCRRGAHHGFQGLGGFGRAMLLPEAQKTAQAHHQGDDDDFGQVGFFAITQRQPVIGEEADNAQGQQYINERVVQRHHELHDRVRRLVVSHFVIAFMFQAISCIQQGQAIRGGPDIGQGGGQAVLRFPCSAHRQLAVFTRVVLVSNVAVFYRAHGHTPVANARQNIPWLAVLTTSQSMPSRRYRDRF